MVRSKKFTGVWLHHLKNKDITYYVQFIDANGKNQKVKIGKKSQKITEQYCYNKRNEIIHKIRLGEDDTLFKNTKKLTFDELFIKYKENLKLQGKNQHGIKCIETRYSLHIKPYIGGYRINNISVDILNKIKLEGIKKLAKKTVDTILTLISTILNFANKTLSLRVENNISNGKVTRYYEDNRRERFLSHEEVDQLLELTKQNISLDRIVRLALSTGGRLRTCYEVKKKDIDINTRTIALTDYKNGGERYYGYLSKKYFPNFDFLDKLDDDDFILTHNGKRYCYSRYQHLFKKIVDPVFNKNIEKTDHKNRLVFHSLRHTFCSLLAIENTPIATIQKLANHKDITNTLRYSKLTTDSIFAEVRRVFDK